MITQASANGHLGDGQAQQARDLPGRIPHLAISQEGFIFDPRNGESYLANETASVLIRELQRGRAADELADELMSRFDVDAAQAQADIGDFLKQLENLHLL